VCVRARKSAVRRPQCTFEAAGAQIPVLGVDGIPVAYLDLGWEDWMVGVEYDGDQHRTDRHQYVKDIRRLEMLEKMGWIVVRVVAEHSPAHILRRVEEAIAASTVRSRF